jgi:hypothetical protein
MSDLEACNRAMAEPSQTIDGRVTHTNFASRGRGPKRPRVANGPSGYAPPAAYPAYAAPQYAAPQYAPQYAAPPAAQYAPQYAADPNAAAAYAAQYVGI